MASPSTPECIRSERERLAEQRGEPVETFERTLQERSNSLYANVPSFGGTLLGLEAGDPVEVEAHDDRIVIRPSEED